MHLSLGSDLDIDCLDSISNYVGTWEKDIKHLMKEELKLLKTLLFGIKANPFFSDSSLAQYYGMSPPPRSQKLPRGGHFNIAFHKNWQEKSNFF